MNEKSVSDILRQDLYVYMSREISVQSAALLDILFNILFAILFAFPFHIKTHVLNIGRVIRQQNTHRTYKVFLPTFKASQKAQDRKLHPSHQLETVYVAFSNSYFHR